MRHSARRRPRSTLPNLKRTNTFTFRLNLLSWRARAGPAAGSPSCSCPIHSGSAIKTSDGPTCTTHTRRGSIVTSPPRQTHPPEQVCLDRCASLPRSRRTNRRHVIQTGLKTPSALSSSSIPGTTRKHTNGSRLPCRDTAGLPSGSNQATLPSYELSITRGSRRRHRAPPRPSHEFPR